MNKLLINTLKEIILDSQEAQVDLGTPRRMQMRPVPNKASICMGVRRCGKSTLMRQHMQHLLDAGVSGKSMLCMNFFDDRLHSSLQDNLHLVSESYYGLYPEKKEREKVYFFFDEIQIITGWEFFVDRLMRNELCEIYITGSSAQMLSLEIASQMRGRALSWELFPFSFREFLDCHSIDASLPFSSKKRLWIQKGFERFWQAGGFPEVARLDQQMRIMVHQEYLGSLLFRDVVERHDIAHPKALSDLAHYLLDNIASLYSINKLTAFLKTLGHKVPKTSVSDYLAWFEDAYFLFTVRLFDASLRRANANPKKIYCIDHAMVSSTSSGILINSGHLLENMVFIALRRSTSNIYYYRTRTGREVDFVVGDASSGLKLIQVCVNLARDATRTREVTAISEAMSELGLMQGMIVTLADEDVIQLESGTITIIPVWRFLLTVEG